MAKSFPMTLCVAEAPVAIGKEPVFSSSDAAKYVRRAIGAADRECFVILHFNSQHRLLASELHSIGTAATSSVYVRDVMKSALRTGSSALIFGHNHPGGERTPSVGDRLITRRLVEAAALLDIETLDHVIVTRDETFSFADEGLIDEYRVTNERSI